jgi:predicted lipoprotein
MSTPMEITAGRRSDRSRRKIALLAAAAILLVAMALDTKVVPIGSSLDMRAIAFSPEAYGRKEFPRIQSGIEQAAVDANVLAGAIAQDADEAAEKYGTPGGIGPIFPVRFSGVVGKGDSGIFNVAVDDLPEGLGIRVQTGPAINGTEVRDATGTISFGQFTNQIEYQDAGAALNNEIKRLILADLSRDELPGKTIEVVGVFQLINPANWLVTPVRLKVTP